MKRLFAVASLLIIGILEMAPHRHADSLEVWLGEDAPQAEEHIVRCDGVTGGVTHIHRNETTRTDSCLACLRHHIRATRSATAVVTPSTLRQFLAVTSRVAHARSIRLRKTSRGPPLSS